jgi:hypothetical protein
MVDDCVNPEVIVLVGITFTPFEHLVVRDNFIPRLVTILDLELEDGVIGSSVHPVSGLDTNDLGSMLLMILIRVGNEGAVQ